MADKRVNCVKVCFDDRLFIDLGRRAAREDRKVADLVYRIVRDDMYGSFRPDASGEEVTDRDHDGP